ncbi:MAG TPA: P-loop NTPase [Paludibacteraceae bacterium]|nr:P-loop NTPase [Paludibacteraceae bacterium]HQB68763.1 P-loop NTPase [Paludibacteraceae bacterium]HRS68225.1 P-loop NTPase [Paludibacteraceae bacterium]
MEIAVISGKGGTGKSSVSAAFATLKPEVVLVDCDVDAANLYLLFNPTHEKEEIFISGFKAVINKDVCTNCDLCVDYCRFDAITNVNGEVVINEIVCDGCKLCSRICPLEAISMIPEDKSRMYSGTFRNGKMVYGLLSPGEENSGQLVDMVREEAKKVAQKNNLDTIIIDGPPGIGCAVISTITGVDKVVIVTEPTLSGLHDLKRTIEIVSKFNLTKMVIINKYDLNVDMSKTIENYCISEGVPVIAKLPFDKIVVDAMVSCKSIIEYAPDSEIAALLTDAFAKTVS